MCTGVRLEKTRYVYLERLEKTSYLYLSRALDNSRYILAEM